MTIDAGVGAKVGRASDQVMLMLSGVAIVAAIVAGGSSSDPMSAGIVRLASLPALLLAIWRLSFSPAPRAAIWPLTLIGFAILLSIAQLIPLPPEVWQQLPGRQSISEAFRAAGMSTPPQPISLTPTQTFNGVLGFIPIAAVFLSVLTLQVQARRRLAMLLIGLAIASVALGALQMFGGEDSPLRPYQFTNRNAAVGFFANRNHQASLLAAMIPLSAALAVSAAGRPGANRNFLLTLGGSVVLVLVLGVAITLSRAGVLLLAPALIASLLIAFPGQRSPSRNSSILPALALAGSMLLGAGLVAAFQFTPLAQRFLAGEQTRPEVSLRVAKAALGYAPVGSGVGSFEALYQMHEPIESLSTSYFNHVHNDYVEVWLEAGVAGVILMLAGLAWWAAALFAVLRRSWSSDQAMALGGAAIAGMLLIHSLVDYPLRTSAAAVVFALACALMIAPKGEIMRAGGEKR